ADRDPARRAASASLPARSTYRVEQELLRAFETGGDLERGQRFLLGFRLHPGEQVALAQIAMGGGLVGGAGVQRSAELAKGDDVRPYGRSGPIALGTSAAARSNGA